MTSNEVDKQKTAPQKVAQTATTPAAPAFASALPAVKDAEIDFHHDRVYEEVKLQDMTYNENEELYQYTCPCGDLFEIGLEDLWDGEDIALCPSCSLKLKVLFTEADLPPLEDLSGEEDGAAQ